MSSQMLSARINSKTDPFGSRQCAIAGGSSEHLDGSQWGKSKLLRGTTSTGPQTDDIRRGPLSPFSQRGLRASPWRQRMFHSVPQCCDLCTTSSVFSGGKVLGLLCQYVGVAGQLLPGSAMLRLVYNFLRCALILLRLLGSRSQQSPGVSPSIRKGGRGSPIQLRSASTCVKSPSMRPGTPQSFWSA